MTLTRYQVTDASGSYGIYDDRMEAIMVCNRLYKEGDSFVRMIEVVEREADWMKDYEELCNG